MMSPLDGTVDDFQEVEIGNKYRVRSGPLPANTPLSMSIET